MKNQLISEITRQMLPFLDNAQMEHLQEVLHHTLWNVQITVPEGAVQEPEKESNEELLNMFLSSKRVEGCSEKTLRYYETSIRRLFSALDIHVTHMQTDDLRTYLSEYQQQSQCSKSNIDNIRRILSSFFTWLEDAQQVVMTNFYPYQWDLNYANPTVFNDMTENLLYLTNRGIDVIRLDAVPYIWKELGTTCRNLPQVHTLVRMMRMVAEIVCPSVLLLGEVVMEPAKVAPYFGTPEKPECHMLYNVTTMATTWHTLATGNVALLRHQMNSVCALPRDFLFLNYLRCHDDIGWGLDYPWLYGRFGFAEVPHKKYLNDYFTGRFPGSDSRGELYNDDPRLGDARLCGTTASLCGVEAAEFERDSTKLERAVACDLMLHAWMLTQSGIPVLYSGDEVGQLNDYSYHQDGEKWDDSRYLHRGNFQWDLAEMRHDETTRQGKQFQGLRHLEEIRAAEPVFDTRADVWTFDTGNPHVLGIGRWYQGRKLIAFFNFSREFASATSWEKGPYKELVYGGEADALDHVELYPYGFAWYLHLE